MIDGVRLDGPHQLDRLAESSEVFVDPMPECMHLRWLRFPNRHQGGPRATLEIVRDRGNECVRGFVEGNVAVLGLRRKFGATSAGQRHGQRRDTRTAQWQTVIGGSTGQARHRLDRIKTRETSRSRPRPAPTCQR